MRSPAIVLAPIFSQTGTLYKRFETSRKILPAPAQLGLDIPKQVIIMIFEQSFK